MSLFARKRDSQESEVVEDTMVDPILKALLEKEDVSRERIMNLPAVSACVNKIAAMVSSLQIKLYEKDGEQIKEVDDPRVYLLNDDTGDTLNGTQFKRAMVEDMYLGKGGYAYVNKVGTEIRSIHYVEENRVGFVKNSDPIFKDYQILVNGTRYEGWKFIKLLRNTTDGFKGKSIIEESQLLLDIIYSTQNFEKNMVKTGGNKKGFIKATKKLAEPAMRALKNAFRKLYSNNTENVVILNDGLDFKESSNSCVELQLNENKKTNNEDICKIFLTPPPIINGGATEEDTKQWLEGCIIPILNEFASAINSVLLLESEKKTRFFAFDTTDILKGDIEKRYNAYKVALDSGFMQLDEVRKKEKLPAFGLKFIKLGLQDVLFYPDENKIYTPNTNKISEMTVDLKKKDEEGGEEDEG